MVVTRQPRGFNLTREAIVPGQLVGEDVLPRPWGSDALLQLRVGEPVRPDGPPAGGGVGERSYPGR